MDEELEKIINFLKEKKEYLVYIILALIAWFGYYIRTLNLNLLQGKYLIDPDAHLVLRYVRYVAEHGNLFTVDPLRSYPIGFSGTEEFSFLSNFIVYLYKFLNFFNPNLTLTEVTIFYPAVAFVLALPFFYLFVKRLFGTRIALLASVFLTIIPVYLFRTMSGVSDKEALAMIFFYAAFYFFIVGWQSKRIRYSILFGAISGLTTGILGAIWGGVAFVIITISSLILIENLFGKLTRKDMYLFLSWALFSYIFLFFIFPNRYGLNFFIYSYLGWILLFTLMVVLIQLFVFELNLLRLKEKLYSVYDLPAGIYGPLIILIMGLIGAVPILGPKFILDTVRKIFELIISRSDSRWGLTVSESTSSFLAEWIVLFGPNNLLGGLPFFHILFWSFIIGFVLFFYEYIKVLHKYKWRLTIIYTLLLFAIIFSRYNKDSVFDGETLISQAFYIGSFLIFIGTFLLLYIYLYYKDKESFIGLSKLDKRYTFILILSLLTAIATRTANRSLFVFAPIIIIFISYLIVKTYQLIKGSNKKNHIKYAFYIILFLIFGWSLYYYSARAVNFAADFGPNNEVQWNIAMEWVKQNTPKDAVFAHWWDYGYYVQTLAERPTVTDGGNVIGYWNYLMGRHFLTAQNETEVLEWLKSHNVSYVLIDPSDIIKYGAFSSIGSDENYDRYSFIGTFKIYDVVKKVGNTTIFAFKNDAGALPFEEDYVYDDTIYPSQTSGIIGFLLPVTTTKNNETETSIGQPQAVVYLNGKEKGVPLKCLYFEGKLFEYNKGLDSCLRIIPEINGDKINKIGAVLYLSTRVKRTLFANIYLFDGKDYPHFELVYSDDKKLPLALSMGRQYGPLKIWKVNYPNNTEFKKEYLERDYPNTKLIRPKDY